MRRSPARTLRMAAAAAALALTTLPAPAFPAGQVDHVIHVSIDGLRPDVVTSLGPRWAPNLHRFTVEGTFTLNARTDFDFTETLPDHTCILTGRAVLGEEGHGVDFNSDTGVTIAEAHGGYVAGVFDVVHDAGLGTALFAGKSKFALFDRSWNEVNGAPDTTGADEGKDKIDTCVYEPDTEALFELWKSGMGSMHWEYSFLHLRDPDSAGHTYGWASHEYKEAVIRMDSLVGGIFALVREDTLLEGRTAIVLTSDHGGDGYSHGDPADPLDYTVPLMVWCPGAPAGEDLYRLNGGVREDPLEGRPGYGEYPQPIRNGDSANLALTLLGLGPVPGSTIDLEQDLAALPAGGPSELPAVLLTSPSENEEHDLYSPVVIQAEASHPAGIDRVEFYADWSIISADSTEPYRVEWLPPGEGEFIVAARAVGAGGLASADDALIVVNQTVSAGTVDGTEALMPSLFPNPVNGPVRLRYCMPRSGHVVMTLFDAAGRLVGNPLDAFRDAGAHTEQIKDLGLASGVYFYRIKAAGRTAGGRLVIVR